MDEIKNHIYQKELFDRLKKSIGLKKEEESFNAILKPTLWWIVDKPFPKFSDIKKIAAASCPVVKRKTSLERITCARDLFGALKKAQQTKAMVRYGCVTGLHGFVYPIIQGDKLYGYIGSCYTKKDISPQLLRVFSSFTDAIVREVQKELELSKLYETIRPRAIALSTVHTVHRLISSTLDLNELLPRIARLSLQLLRANRCSIKLIDSTKKMLLPKVTIDLRKRKTVMKRVRVGMWAPGKAVKFAKPIRSHNYLAVPLIDEDVIGVITLYDKTDSTPFTAFDQEIMSTLAEQAVIAIKNAQLYKEQERLTLGSIKSLATILGTRPHGAGMPRASFSKICFAIGLELHLSQNELKSLEYAALLHDAGQVTIPDEVLSKTTKLTGREYDIIKEHPVKGVEIIRHMKALKSLIPIILYHHENYDGTGYPKGLKKDQIPVGARIMAVVSAFEAMITKRPYRPIKTVDEAIEDIKSNSGTQFDPKVVDILLKVMKQKDISAILKMEQK